MQQVADKMNFQDPVQKYAECHSWDMNNSNATKYHEIKVGILDNTCFKENVPTFEILVGWILRLGLNFWVINVALYGWKCDPAYPRTFVRALKELRPRGQKALWNLCLFATLFVLLMKYLVRYEWIIDCF